MKKIAKYLYILLLGASFAACDDEGLDVLDVEIPDGYALSAGTSTIFVNSSFAYDSPADWVSSNTAYKKRFYSGDGL